MILSDYAVCKAPGLYALCMTCRRNLDNHDEATRKAVRSREFQASVSPDSRKECRHHQYQHSPEDRL